MTLVDTSIWVDHFRSPNLRLVRLLGDGAVGVHPFIIGELACGNLRNRARTLVYLQRLPQAPVGSEREAHHLLSFHRLSGTGLGWVDVHLLASAVLARWDLLTADRALNQAAARLGIADGTA